MEIKYKKILAILFLLVMGVVWINSGSFTSLQKIEDFLRRGVGIHYFSREVGSEDSTLTMDMIETEYASQMWKRQDLINFNGAVAKLLRMQGYYGSKGIYITEDRYIVSPSPWTSTDYEYDQMLSLYHFLLKKDIHLMYINEPNKYVDDSLFEKNFGIESYSNRNADSFLQRIKKAGIHVIDLRDELKQDKLNIYDMFYRTDHHWTTRSGLWASEKIAKGLNKYCGYAIDTSIYDEENYSFTNWKACWLGEQGRVVAASYVGLDDYTAIKPKFATNYTFKNGDILQQGTFEDFINEDVYNADEDVYVNPSWHYSYSQPNVINNNVEYGKVLILGDSYEQVVVPFLSLGVSEVDSIILRSFSGNIRDYIEQGEYDTVLICYAQFMIGAHDDTESANYKMFTFEQ